jgi:hypothetical protein
MFVVSVVCCQVEVSATNWSLVQRSPTDCGASLCVIDSVSTQNKQAEPMGDACSKTQLSKLGQNKITS